MIGKYFGDFFRQLYVNIRQPLRQILVNRAFRIARRFRQRPYGKSSVQQHFAEAHASPPNLLVHALFLSCQLRFFLYSMRQRRQLCLRVMGVVWLFYLRVRFMEFPRYSLASPTRDESCQMPLTFKRFG